MRFLVGILASVMRTGRPRRTGGVARHDPGCTVVAVGAGDHFDPTPDALEPLPAESELVLVGDAEAETRFIERFGRAAPAG